jgi:hypothetical protein
MKCPREVEPLLDNYFPLPYKGRETEGVGY